MEAQNHLSLNRSLVDIVLTKPGGFGEAWFERPRSVKRLTCWNHRDHPNVFINLCRLFA